VCLIGLELNSSGLWPSRSSIRHIWYIAAYSTFINKMKAEVNLSLHAFKRKHCTMGLSQSNISHCYLSQAAEVIDLSRGLVKLPARPGVVQALALLNESLMCST